MPDSPATAGITAASNSPQLEVDDTVRVLLPDSFCRAMVPMLEAAEKKRAERPEKPAGCGGADTPY